MVLRLPLVSLIPLICLIVVGCAFWAGRASRNGHRLMAVLVNLTCLGLLLLGFAGLASFRHARANIARQAATLAADELLTQPAEPVRSSPAPRDQDEPAAVETVPAEQAPSGAVPPPEAAEAEAAAADAPIPAEAPEGTDTAASAPPSGPSARDLQLNPQAYIDFQARPDWVDREELDVGPVHQVSVCSGPFLRAREARDELYKQLKTETDRYINELVADPRAAQWLDYGEAEIRSRFVTPGQVYHEKVVSPSFGVMHQSHALLTFGPEFREEVQANWRQLVARGRLAGLAIGAAMILGTLGLLFGYFHVDTATRGFYSGRLRFSTAVAILGLIVAGVWLVSRISWIWL